jgi:uncharacterized protein with FMN-binding domain
MSSPQARTGRNAAVFGATAAAAAVLFIYPTSTNSGGPGPRTQTAPPAGIVSPSTKPGTAAGAAGSAKTPKTVVVNGSPADTEFGPVQVQLNVSGGRIVSATAINYPQESGHDLRINSYAIPVLQQETVSAQNAQIDTVSGATVTSNGYRQSLQSALDAAHLG